MESAASV